MDFTTFLPRRLSQGGCVIAGTQLAARHEQIKAELKNAKNKLAPKVEAAVLKTLERTKAVEVLVSNEAAIVDIDRGTDRCIAGVGDQLDAIERAFDRGALLPLTDQQAARLADARLVRGALLPSGTVFLRQPYSQQWVEMKNMLRALDGKDVAAAVERLGLEAEMHRIRSWVALYGARLGVTEIKDADPAAVAVDAWHQAYGELMVRVHDAYDDPKDPSHEMIRRALTSPYQSQVDEERRLDQKARDRRRSAEPEPTEK